MCGHIPMRITGRCTNLTKDIDLDVAAAINSAIQQAAQANNTASSQFSSTTFNYQDQNTTISQAIQNVVSTNIQEIVSNTCYAQSILGNNATVDITSSAIAGALYH